MRSGKFEDSSFYTALTQLRKARSNLAEHGRHLSIRCFFLEEDPDAFIQLKRFADEAKDVEIEVRNDTLEQSIEHIVDFVNRSGKRPFPFIFVDPTG